MDTERSKIVSACVGCSRVTLDGYCTVYIYPDKQHGRLGGCAMRTHNKAKRVEETGFLDPLKKSKRKARGKA